MFAVLAGLELVTIALAPLSFSIHQGMPGVASWLCGVILVLCGVLACTQPQQRSFFGILAVLFSLGSFVTSNLGGFLLGLLLGLVGGGLIFAWTPRPEVAPEQPIDLGEPGGSGYRERPELEAPRNLDLEVPQSFGNERPQLEAPSSSRSGRHRSSLKALAAGVLPAAVGLHLGTAPSPQPTPTPQPTATATPQPTSQPSASPSASPSPTQSGGTTSPKAGSGAGTSCPTLPSQGSSGLSLDQARTLLKALTTAPPTCLAQLNTPAPKANSTGGVVWSSQPATLKASDMWMYGMSYDGVVGLPTAHGSVQVLKFSMDKASLDGVDQKIGSGSSGLTAPNLVFDSGVVMYTTKLTGSLLGIPITLEPGSPLLPVLQALNVLHLPVVELSNIVAEQPAVATGSATVTQMGITA